MMKRLQKYKITWSILATAASESCCVTAIEVKFKCQVRLGILLTFSIGAIICVYLTDF